MRESGSPAFTYDLIGSGSGTGRARFAVQRTGWGEPLLAQQPLVTTSVAHELVAVPERGTLALMASGLAAAYGLRCGSAPRSRDDECGTT